MSYADRMCVRMLAWCLVPVVASIPISVIASTILTIPAMMGGQAAPSDVPFLIAMAGACFGMVIFAIQGILLWRWRLGKTDDCWICGCLLGREQDGRWGPYRRCLGCGKNHSARE